MGAESREEVSPLTVSGNPAKDGEESEEIMDGLLQMNRNDDTMEGN